MKCLSKNGVVKRVQDVNATILINQGWSYAPKSEWKVAKAGKTSTTHDDVIEEAVKKVKKAKGAKVKKQKVEEVVIEVEVTPVTATVPKVAKKAKKKVTVEG